MFARETPRLLDSVTSDIYSLSFELCSGLPKEWNDGRQVYGVEKDMCDNARDTAKQGYLATDQGMKGPRMYMWTGSNKVYVHVHVSTKGAPTRKE